MTDDIRLLKEIIQSSNINFLIGAGASMPYLPILGDIEKKIVEAKGDKKKELEQLRRYFNEVMYPCLNILNGLESFDGDDRTNFDATYNGYKRLFNSVNLILLNRKGSLLNKQANIFTTNIDIFMEKVLEDINLEYNDGFSGNINPIFQTSNFHKSINKTSSHFSNVSEIPILNIIKLHGSLSWQADATEQKIIYSRLKLLKDLKAVASDDDKFKGLYKDLQVVNPTKDKFKQTVMGVTHYELLRMYSSDLEKENSVLFVIGFSMADEHIREITLRAANSNPTLKIYIFSHSACKDAQACQDAKIEEKCNYHKYIDWFSNSKYKNVEILAPLDDANYDVVTVTASYLEAIFQNAQPEADASESLEDSEPSK